jgi:hypothetical protein
LGLVLLGTAGPAHAETARPRTSVTTGICQGKDGSTWIRCVVAAADASALGPVLDKIKAYPHLVPIAAAQLALATNPERLLELAREAEQRPAATSGRPVDRTARVRGALAAMGVLLQRVRLGTGGRVPRALEDGMLAFCADHVRDKRAAMTEAAIACVGQVHDQRATRVLCDAVGALEDEAHLGAALSSLAKRGHVPDWILTDRLIDLIASPIDESGWRQSQLEQKLHACRLLRNREEALAPAQRDLVAAAVTAVRARQSQVADACAPLASSGDVAASAGAVGATATTFRPQKIAFDYVVRAGDTMDTINDKLGEIPFGGGYEIYADPMNEKFRRANPDPDHLAPGGLLRVADHDQRLVVRVLGEEGAPFRLFLEGIEVDGTFQTDPSGQFVVRLPPTIKAVQVILRRNILSFTLDLASSATILGIQQRLASLGFGAPATGELDAQTLEAIGNFQSNHGLEQTNDLSEETRMRIIDEYGN